MALSVRLGVSSDLPHRQPPESLLPYGALSEPHGETGSRLSRPHHYNRAQPVSSPPVQKCCTGTMSVSVAGIPKNCCRTTVAEPIGGNASGTALYRGPSRSV